MFFLDTEEKRKILYKKYCILFKAAFITIIIYLILRNYITNENHIQKNINNNTSNKINNPYERCYLPSDNFNIKIIHLVMTKFLIDYFFKNNFPKIMHTKEYVLNGIRVMKNYLFPSLENQSCKKFKWILMLGDKANITYIKSILNFNNSFEMDIVYNKSIQNYIRNISKGYDVLITSRIDYDDRIYYDAVNDVRKMINIKRPMFIHGYNRGVNYYEIDKKYYDFDYNFNNEGALGIFLSLIVVLNKVNDTYNIYEIGAHTVVRKMLLNYYKKYGIKELKYDPAYFDGGQPKFVYVRQNYSTVINFSMSVKKRLKHYNFNLSKFYGK